MHFLRNAIKATDIDDIWHHSERVLLEPCFRLPLRLCKVGLYEFIWNLFLVQYGGDTTATCDLDCTIEFEDHLDWKLSWIEDEEI